MAKQSGVRKTGLVVGHIIRYIPKKEEQLDKGITITKQHKIGAFLQLSADNRLYTVQCPHSTLLLEMNEDPTSQRRIETFNVVLNNHPAGSSRVFYERDSDDNRRYKRYILADQQDPA